MADSTIRFFEFETSAGGLFGGKEVVGFDKVTKKENRFPLEDLMLFLGVSDFSDAQIQTWLDAGFSWLDIGVFLLKHENLRNRPKTPFIFARVPSDQVDALIAYIKTPQGFAKTGIALCDGTAFADSSGTSWNLKNRHPKGYAPSISVDGATIVPYQTQEDAMQEFSGTQNIDINQKLDLDETISLDKTVEGNLNDIGLGDSNNFNGIVSRTTTRLKNGIGSGNGTFGDFKFTVRIQWSQIIQKSWTVAKNWTISWTNKLSGIKTSSETRSKAIFFPYFQVVNKIDWETFNYKQPESLTP